MNYTELIDAAKTYADRNDVKVADSMGVFILMVEARINRILKTREQSARSYTPTVDNIEYYPLPDDYAGMRDFQLNSKAPTVPHSTQTFEYLAPSLFNSRRNSPYVDEIYYTIIANQIQIYPIQKGGKTLEMVYYQRVPPLNQATPTNWLSDSHPDIYLSGLMAEIESFVKNYDVAKLWFDKMSLSLGELDSSDDIERWSGTPLVIRNEMT